MKKFILKANTPYPQNPIILAVGNIQTLRQSFSNYLSDQNNLSQKFGRIIYIGEQKLKNQKIQYDQENTINNNDYNKMIELIDSCKVDKIVNLLVVFFSKNMVQFHDMIQKLIGIRFNSLPGVIVPLIICEDIDQVSKHIFSLCNGVYLFGTKFEKIIQTEFNVKLKKKKNHFVKKDKVILI